MKFNRLLRILLVAGSVLVLWAATAKAASIYVLSSGNTTEDDLVQTVLGGRFGSANVTIGPQFFNFDGTQDLSSYSAVLLLCNYNWNS